MKYSVSIYPSNIAQKLDYNQFNLDSIPDLAKRFPKNLIIRIYGFAGVGKGTISKMLSDSLNIANVESSFILRCVTLIYLDLKLDITNDNTDLVFSKMKVWTDSKSLNFEYNNSPVTAKELKTPEIDKQVPILAQNQYIRDKFDDYLDNLVQSMDKAFIADGRGSHEPYLVKAEKRGQPIIRILLDASDEVKAERYLAAFMAKNPDADKEKQLEILEEFKNTIIVRNNRDAQNIIEKNLGLISADSGLIDTSDFTATEVLEIALNFIDSKLSEIEKN